MNLFPFFEDIENKKFLVVGGGSVAARKIEKILEFTDRITVIAPAFTETQRLMHDPAGEKIRWVHRSFWKQDLEEADVVICAADDPVLNANIAKLCLDDRIPVNVVDNPALCTFIFPAVIHRGDLTVAVSTNGKSPAASAYVRHLIEEALPDYIGDLVKRMGDFRDPVLTQIPAQKDRAALFAEILSLLLQTEGKATDKEIEEKIALFKKEINKRAEVERETAGEAIEAAARQEQLDTDPDAPKEDIYVAKPWIEEEKKEDPKRVFSLAARGSCLSRIQARQISDLLADKGCQTEFTAVVTEGDANQKDPLSEIGGKGLFVKEIEKRLLNKEADIAVHSAKDLPRELAEGLVIGGMPEMADPRDCLVFRTGTDLSGRILTGTGSRRRESELSRLYPSMAFQEARGNVDTRIKKLREGTYDAVVLAKAGLDRLKPDLSGLQVKVLETDACIPAPCQGILALECRRDDKETLDVLASVTDEQTRKRFEVERYLMRLLQTDCHEAFGAYAQLFHNDMAIYAMYNGKRVTIRGRYESYKVLCEEVRIALTE